MLTAGLRVLAIYCLIQGVHALQGSVWNWIVAFSMNRNSPIESFGFGILQQGLTALPIVLYTALGIWLWLKAPSLDAKYGAGEVERHIDTDMISRTALAIAGIVIVVNHFGLAMQALGSFVNGANSGMNELPLWSFFSHLLIVLAGMALFFGRAALVSVWHTLRYGK